MYDLIIIAVCVIVCIKTFSYGVWCFKNTGIAGGIAVMVVAVLTLTPFFIV